MKAIWPLAVVVSSVILGSAYLFAHRFEIVPLAPSQPQMNGNAWVLDKLTGRAKHCGYQQDKVIFCEVAVDVSPDLSQLPTSK